MEKINLNFFGEEVTIDTPKDLSSLREKISEKYSLSKSDVAEIILYYIKDSKKIYIINGDDYSKFKESKISSINLDVNQNSKLYLDNVSKVKNEIKEEKKESIDIEKEKETLQKLETEKEAIRKQEKEKYSLYNDKLSQLIKQKAELEKIIADLEMERDLDMCELRDKRTEVQNKINEIKEKIEPKKKEDVILKEFPKPAKKMGYQIRSGQNNFPYPKESLKRNYEKEKKYFERLKAAKEKRMKERKALEEKKALESKNEEILKNMQNNMPDSIPIFIKVNEVLKNTIQKVKDLAKEKVMTQEEKEIAKNEETLKKEKEKTKKQQIEKVQKITRDAVKEINNLTKIVIEQANSLIEKINNPQLYRSSSTDDILLRTAPKPQKKVKPEIHYNIICDGCKVTPLRGNRYKCKKCKDFDFCEECYKINKESHGHDFTLIAHPRCRNRLGHKNTKYCQRGIVHSKIMCDGCGMFPMKGYRFKCAVCEDFNLCENCEEKTKHFHPFVKISTPSMQNTFNDNYLKLNTYQPPQ